MEKCIIDVEDYLGNRVILTEKKWQQKSIQHPELKSKIFLRNLEETVRNPTEAWEDYGDKKHRKCYYKKYSKDTYVKAVIWFDSNPCYVISAFETNKIKEEIYQPDIKRLK